MVYFSFLLWEGCLSWKERMAAGVWGWLYCIVLRKQRARPEHRSAPPQPLPLARPRLLKDPQLCKKPRLLRTTCSNMSLSGTWGAQIWSSIPVTSGLGQNFGGASTVLDKAVSVPFRTPAFSRGCPETFCYIAPYAFNWKIELRLSLSGRAVA